MSRYRNIKIMPKINEEEANYLNEDSGCATEKND
jgi:hypothetical protein